MDRVTSMFPANDRTDAGYTTVTAPQSVKCFLPQMIERVIVGSRPNLTHTMVTCHSIKAGMEICRLYSCWRDEIVDTIELGDGDV